MSRQHRRASRPLIALLLAILSVGIFCVEYRWKHHHPAVEAIASDTSDVIRLAAPSPAPQPTPTAAPDLTDVPPQPVQVTPAPTTQPIDTQWAASLSDPVVNIQSILTRKPAATEPSSNQAVLASQSAAPTNLVSSPHLLADAQEKIASGNLLEARNQLNAALQSGQLGESEAASAKAAIAQISQTVVFGPQRFPEDPYGGTYVVHGGDSLTKIAMLHDTTWNILGRINGIDPRHLRSGATIKVLQGPFFAVVTKRKFTMDIYLGGLPGEKSSMYVTTYQVGLGKDDSTPTGTWMIEPHHKLKHPTYYSPRGEGVIAADDPKNPLGGYWIGLTGTQGRAIGQLSYGIHGTIEPDSIGKQSSMGCIRMRADDISVVFDLMVEGKSMVLVNN